MPNLKRRQVVAATLLLPVVAATRAHAATYQVTIEGFAFSPASFVVEPGDKISFFNADNAPHTATAEDGSFDTGRIDPGQRVEVTIPAGRHPYYCAFHPGMTGVANAS